MSLLNPQISATTLSVVLNVEDSVSCYVELDDVSCNLTLRLDDEKARLAGFPHSWKTWDELIPGSDDFSYADAETDGSIDSWVDEIEAMDAYVSRETEKIIFIKIKESLEKQFGDSDFKERLAKADQERVLQKIDLAIKQLI